jgi:hypothetical protein
MKLLWALVVIGLVAAAGDGISPPGTGRAAGGGVVQPAPVGKAVVAAPDAADAGVAVTPPPAADGGAQTQSELDRLKDEELRSRREVEALRAQLEAERQQVEQLRQMNDQMEELRVQLADEAQARSATEQQREARIAASKQASVNLLELDAQLATGDTSGVLELISAAEQVVGSGARDNLEEMRQAIVNDDLTMARVYLWRAAMDAEQLR